MPSFLKPCFLSRQICLQLLLFAAFFSCAESAEQTDGATKALAHKVQAWNDHDLNEVTNAYLNSEDTSFITSSAETKGFGAIKKQYQKWYGNDHNSMGKIGTSAEKALALGKNHVLCTGKWSLDEPNRPHEQGDYTLIYVRTQAGWKILREHLSLRSENN